MAKITYRPEGVCSRGINIESTNGKIDNVEFIGGCEGNLKAIGKLVRGRNVDEVIDLLEGNTCGKRDTSCADQLAQALKTINESAE